MEQIIIDYLKSMDIAQLLATGLMFWFFYRRLNSKIDRSNGKIDGLNTKLETGFKELGEKIHTIDIRLSRIEGILHAQDCCAIKASNDIRKAE